MTTRIPTHKARAIFARMKEIQRMILEAQADLKQAREDAAEELGIADMEKSEAQEVKAELAEIVALAKIEAKGEIEREKVAAKMARRRAVAAAVGVQLDLLEPVERAPDATGVSHRAARLMSEMGEIAEVSVTSAGVRTTYRDGEMVPAE